MSAVVLDQVDKRYGKHLVLQKLSLAMPDGMIGLLGPNGAGKTTLIRLLTGFLQPSGGTITLGGVQIGDDAALRRLRGTLGYVPQRVAFYPTWTVQEFVDYIAQLKGLHGSVERRRAVERSLEQVGLLDQAAKKTQHLSGGMARRLAIAQAIVNDPEILIVDEPTAGLDPEERMRFRQLLSRLGAGRTVLFSTHIVEDIAQTCDQVIILNQQILYAGTIQHLLSSTDQARVVWDVQSAQPLDRSDWTIVQSQSTAHGYRYRVVSATRPTAEAQPLPSGLEEGYAWIMQQHKNTHSA
jgi:ABC-2 type transport system ATP-binding protein